MRKGLVETISVTVLALMLLAALAVYIKTEPDQPENKTVYTGPKIDDWQYNSSGISDGASGWGAIPTSIGKSLGGGAGGSIAPSAMRYTAAENIGFSTGGAKDINNFRDNIDNNYLPIHTDLTYEGLFYDYYFDTGQAEFCGELFCPSYSYAVSMDPVSDETEYYMTVGLNSGIKESDFERKNLNLVVVLDISGSMSSSFNRYYYDQFGNKVEIDEEDEDWEKRKIEVAREAVVMLLDHLEDDDSFGLVLFDNDAYLAKPLSKVGKTDMDAIKDHILEIEPHGGTYMEAGMRMGTDQFNEYLEVDQTEYENRIIFLTDAMPNIGDISEGGLGGILVDNADKGIYTTFIGIGVDFNTELVEAITKVKGANYYSVHSNKQFKERMDEGFDYMVTPLVFDLELTLDSEGYEIVKVYGSPEADESTGTLMKVNTLFPSKTEDGETKGGIVLLNLRKTSEDGTLTLRVSYEDREGNRYSNEKTVEFGGQELEYFQNNGIRKGVLLSRYADLMKTWVIDERASLADDKPIEPWIYEEVGIIPPPLQPQLGRWERQSTSLRVSQPYKDLFRDFAGYFEEEMDAIGDDTLEQELDLLNKLSNH